MEGTGWVSFDPTLGRSPEEHHVRIAVALDATGAAPVAGSRLGEGDDKLDVEVDGGQRGIATGRTPPVIPAKAGIHKLKSFDIITQPSQYGFPRPRE